MSASLQRQGDGIVVAGGMTQETAAALLAEGTSALTGVDGNAELRFDLSAVAQIDSSGLAVLFGWQRAARAQGKSLCIINPPKNLISLAEVYGVSELLTLS